REFHNVRCSRKRSTLNIQFSILHNSNAPPLQSSCPSLHLLRERALRAIGVVLQTKVFVNLEQPLLARHGFQKLPTTWIVPEKAGGPGLKPPIRQTRRQLCVFHPNIELFRDPKWN